MQNDSLKGPGKRSLIYLCFLLFHVQILHIPPPPTTSWAALLQTVESVHDPRCRAGARGRSSAMDALRAIQTQAGPGAVVSPASFVCRPRDQHGVTCVSPSSLDTPGMSMLLILQSEKVSVDLSIRGDVSVGICLWNSSSAWMLDFRALLVQPQPHFTRGKLVAWLSG